MHSYFALTRINSEPRLQQGSAGLSSQSALLPTCCARAQLMQDAPGHIKVTQLERITHIDALYRIHKPMTMHPFLYYQSKADAF